MEKYDLLRRASRADTTSHLDEWINSPGLAAEVGLHCDLKFSARLKVSRTGNFRDMTAHLEKLRAEYCRVRTDPRLGHRKLTD